ncbi:unnamed protein product [Symbiodinium sp. CCMP2592]|nr:unnamed protein product [Symbiodinium sp. CCMP2592]
MTTLKTERLHIACVYTATVYGFDASGLTITSCTCCRLAVCALSSTPRDPRVSIAVEQLQEVFGPLVTDQLNLMDWAPTKREAEPSSAPPDRSKAQRTEQGKGRPWQSASAGRPPWRKGGVKGRHNDGPNLTYLIKALARLALQQETALKILRQDYSWVLFVQPGNQGPLPLLFAAAQKWKKSQEEGATTTALRTTLFGETPTPFQKKAEEMNWLQDGSWCYQKWSPALGSLVVDEDRPPLQHTRLVEALQLILPIIMQPYMIHRFHATWPLAGNMTGITTIQLDLSNRTRGHQTVWEALEALTGCWDEPCCRLIFVCPLTYDNGHGTHCWCQWDYERQVAKRLRMMERSAFKRGFDVMPLAWFRKRLPMRHPWSPWRVCCRRNLPKFVIFLCRSLVVWEARPSCTWVLAETETHVLCIEENLSRKHQEAGVILDFDLIWDWSEVDNLDAHDAHMQLEIVFPFLLPLGREAAWWVHYEGYCFAMVHIEDYMDVCWHGLGSPPVVGKKERKRRFERCSGHAPLDIEESDEESSFDIDLGNLY